MVDKFIYRRSARVRWMYSISLFLALVVDSLILALGKSVMLPPFTVLTLLFWSGHFLDRSYIITAFILGLCLDTLYQTVLGSHAAILITITYVMTRHRLHFSGYTYWQQAFYVSGYLFAYQTTVFLFYNPVLTDYEPLFFWTTPLFGGVIWLALAPVLNRLSLQMET